MAKLHQLTQRQINEAQKAVCTKQYRLTDGGGLSLHVRPNGLYWGLEVTIKAAVGAGKRVAVGLGHYPDLSLTAARQIAGQHRLTASAGIDPREERKAQLEANQTHRPTFKEIFHKTFEAKKAELVDGGKAGNWDSPVRLHALPHIGDTPIEDLTQHDIVRMIKPIWHSKASIAGKCMDRVGLTFKHAAAMDLDVSLETVPKARLLLGKQDHKAKSHEAMPWHEVPAFYDQLNDDLVTHLALKLVINTAARSANVAKARVEEFADGVWTIPAEKMKGTKSGKEEFKIPLSTEAQRLVEHAIKNSRNGFLFPGIGKSGHITTDGILRVLQKRDLPYKTHGFRSTLRDWLTEETDCPYDTKEKILGHKVGNAVSRAYDRTSDLKKRAMYMQLWANFVTNKPADNVLPLRASYG